MLISVHSFIRISRLLYNSFLTTIYSCYDVQGVLEILRLKYGCTWCDNIPLTTATKRLILDARGSPGYASVNLCLSDFLIGFFDFLKIVERTTSILN